MEKEILRDLRNGRIDVIVQVQMLGEGFDHPPLSVAAVFRPFRSLSRHFLQGHVDAIAVVRKVEPKEGSVEMWVEVPRELRRYVVEKGSVGLDGISLTVTAIDGNSFGVSLVPHTLGATTIGERRIGDRMNFEVDMVAKYVERLLEERDQR